MHAKGRGVADELSQQTTVVAPGAAVLGRLPLAPRLSSFLGVTGLVPLYQDDFFVKAGKVHEIPMFSVQITLGIGFGLF